MKVANGSVVSIEYRLHLGDGRTIDASHPENPMVYLQGAGQIVPGLERAMVDMAVGETKQVVVAPEDGYGPHNPAGVQDVPRGAFPPDVKLEVGMELMAQGPQGESVPFIITALGLESVQVDLNHPLAGKTLHFEVLVREVREPTEDEKAHGHAHGPDGHGHDH